jgi:hypothetical protein
MENVVEDTAYNSGAPHLRLKYKFSNASIKDSANNNRRNETVRKDLQIRTVKEEMSRHSTQYSKRLISHPYELILKLQEKGDCNYTCQ